MACIAPLLFFIFQNDEYNNIKQSFQDGCNTLVSKCTELGVTPISNSPIDIAQAIEDIYDNRYNEGYEDGKADSPISSGSLVASFKGSHYHDYTDTGSQSGSVDFDCSRIWVSCAGFTNHNAVLQVYGSSSSLHSISLNSNGNYEWSGTGIRSWNISYNYPSGYSTINYSYIIRMYL